MTKASTPADGRPKSLKELSEQMSLGPRNDDEIKDELQAVIAAKVSLIENVDAAHHPEIVQFVMYTQTDGRGLHDLVPYFQIFDGIDYLQARELASWQVRLVATARTIIRFKRAGGKKFKWLHSGVGCPEHAGLSGKTFPLSDPPVIDKKTGQRGYPNDLSECRCRMQAAQDF